MAEFKVGAPKARAILAALAENDEKPLIRSLRAVPDASAETDSEPSPATEPEAVEESPMMQVTEVADSGTSQPTKSWPLLLLALPAFVAIWGGWVGLGRLTGFGSIQLLPGIWDGLSINSAITLPIGVETYAAFALRVWLSGSTRSDRAREFAKWSAFGSLGLGMAGQVAYHLMSAAADTRAPWLITMLVSCLPVIVLGCGAALAHLLREATDEEVSN
ncbi:ABC transporter permease [Amycolatopsis rhizosphaerae]|nr:ABC transporter permease [Amycolatopsis rhizosphaerae]